MKIHYSRDVFTTDSGGHIGHDAVAKLAVLVTPPFRYIAQGGRCSVNRLQI
jgi:hypothetical protein